MKSRKSTPDIMGNLMAAKSPEPAPKEQMNQVNEIPRTKEPEAKLSSQKGLSSGWTRATFIIHEEFNEKIKAIAYWDRLTVKEVVHDALMQYLRNRNVKPIPKNKNEL